MKVHSDDRMSGMGQMARRSATFRHLPNMFFHPNASFNPMVSDGSTAPSTGDDDPNNGEGYMENPAGGQAETSLAVDSSGMHIVIGFNDTRGFSLNPTSVSGYMYSDDGGLTFTDGGQLPVTTGISFIGSTALPQVFGDPDVHYCGGSNFVYASIMVKKISATGTAQTMCVHRSTDFGHTWTGPYEVTAATNPHGLLSGANARDAADKEFSDIDPVTGRMLLTWSNFTSVAFAPGGVEISSTYCDNLFSATPPTWSARVIVANSAADGQASCPRFGPGGTAYVAWRRFPGGNNQNVGFASSATNGASWTVPSNTTTNFFTMDQVIGNDRINTSPSLAVDRTSGALYVVYADNDNRDGADVVFQKSIDGGANWSAAMALNSRPGSDGPQWYPWVTVDQGTGRVHVFYLDQGEVHGDVTDTTWTYSDDAGVHWSAPNPLNDRPYNCGLGNDTGQPNLGDYNQGVAQGGMLYAVWAGLPTRISWADGQPTSASMTWPDATFKKATGARAALRLEGVTFQDSHHDGVIDPNETIHFQLPLQSYAPSHGGFTGITGTLSSSTPGVSILTGASAYPDIAAGGMQTNSTDFVIKISPGFVPGTFITLSLSVTSAQGSTTLLYDQKTGFGTGVVFYSEDFTGVVAPALPAGWATSHAGGNNVKPWTTTNSRLGAGGNNALWHQNENDGLSGNSTRFERAFSPIITVPGGDFVTIEFDTSYNLEDDSYAGDGYGPSVIQAFDGMLLRVTDQTAGAVLRSVQLEAFGDEFTIGGSPNYPKHLPRSSNANYFQDMNVVSGWSHGYKHVRLKAYGMNGRKIQLRFEYTQDSGATGLDTNPAAGDAGVLVDNIVLTSFTNGVTPDNPPVAVADSYITNQDTPLSGNVLANDSDPDFGDVISAVKDTNPLNGTVSLNSDGSFLYTPNTGFFGSDSFTYHANDGMLDSNVATVSIYVDGKPTANAGSNQTITWPGTNVIVTLDGSASSDPENETLTYLWKEGPTTIGTTAVVMPSLGMGHHIFTLMVTDTRGQSSIATVEVDIIVSWSGVLQPINADGSSIFKLGSTIPVKFTLTGASTGGLITAHIYLAKISGSVVGTEVEAVSTSTADVGNTFRSAPPQWIFNLATKGLSTGTWQVRIDLGDGEIHIFNISLK
ncbi:MAG: PxKF domain-containing protein [Fimbriimonas ginsengisoli]|uniref:PxKF domain-containing protein n=1 Tax=Fimbriimonas ginsengisoli TaxID=1005039 RepID=A0A931LWL8_FIMGI|nr:PxKF domain-containing protein [Fimbriimonas ginsengisoli]